MAGSLMLPRRRGLRSVRALAPLRALAVVVVATVAVASCGDGDSVAELVDDTGSTTSVAETSTTTAPPDTTTTSESSDTTTSVREDTAVGDAWARTASEFRGQIGETVEVDCPAGGQVGSAWGSNVYTDDSSICTAAVHVGLITVAEGGQVTIEVLGGQEEFFGSEFNAVTSTDYGPYGGSFSFPAAESLDVEATIDWARTGSFYGGRDRTEFTVDCEPNGVASSVWGTDTYTADSSICTAAVHVGLITFEEGGKVALELVDGANSYEGSEANGVTSQGYGAYNASFVLPRA